MAFCSKCGKEVHDEAVICVGCGCRLNDNTFFKTNDGLNTGRFLLTFLLGFIGSFIINHTSLKPDGWKSRTLAYLFLSPLTFGIYKLVASIYNFNFDTNKSANIGFYKQ